MENDNQLLSELNHGRKEIKTDGYSMSIGEIINLYRENELELAPAYQRLFRWEDEQKSRFIESILLGIPLPPIFVAQKEGGKWSIVDGLQRISTILQLTGDLRDKSPLTLSTTNKLPSLEGYTWTDLPEDIKRILKRAKIGINIILTENSVQAQYELFQRLNTGGSHLEPQEIRNCLIIMLNESFYDEINALKTFDSFKKSLGLQSTKIEIEFPMELILRYFIAKHNIDFEAYRATRNMFLSEFIDKETIKLIQDSTFDLQEEKKIFERTFNYLYTALGENTFKKFNFAKNTFEGAFSQSAFEAITPGVSLNIDKYEQMSHADFLQKIKDLYNEEKFIEYSKRGNKALYRIEGLTAFSKAYFE